MNKKFNWLEYVNFCRKNNLKPLKVTSLNIYFKQFKEE